MSRWKRSALGVFDAGRSGTSLRGPRLSQAVNPYRLVSALSGSLRRGMVPCQSNFISCREHLLLDVDVESSIEAAPAAAELTPFAEVYRKLEIEST